MSWRRDVRARGAQDSEIAAAEPSLLALIQPEEDSISVTQRPVKKVFCAVWVMCAWYAAFCAPYYVNETPYTRHRCLWPSAQNSSCGAHPLRRCPLRRHGLLAAAAATGRPRRRKRRGRSRPHRHPRQNRPLRRQSGASCRRCLAPPAAANPARRPRRAAAHFRSRRGFSSSSRRQPHSRWDLQPRRARARARRTRPTAPARPTAARLAASGARSRSRSQIPWTARQIARQITPTSCPSSAAARGPC